MSSRLDELLSPERLRDRWQEEEAQPADEAPAVAPLQPDHPMALVARLEALASERFPGTTAHGLPVLIGRLRELVEQAYRSEGGEAAREPAAIDAAQIKKLLDQIDDLVEALDLGRRR